MIAIGADHGGFQIKEAVKKYLEEKAYHIRISVLMTDRLSIILKSP